MNYVVSKEQYLNFQNAFKTLAHNKDITHADIMLYNIVRGFNPSRGFTPITNTQKLQHGKSEWSGRAQAKFNLNHSIIWSKDQIKSKFSGTLSDEDLAQIQLVLAQA